MAWTPSKVLRAIKHIELVPITDDIGYKLGILKDGGYQVYMRSTDKPILPYPVTYETMVKIQVHIMHISEPSQGMPTYCDKVNKE